MAETAVFGIRTTRARVTMSHTHAAGRPRRRSSIMTGTLLLALALAGPTAQQPAAPAAPAAAAAASPMVASVRGGYDLVKGHILKAADQVSEENYAFKATPDVRSL